jgi:ubiquinol-cytochrome c reductase cytochrome b subunit
VKDFMGVVFFLFIFALVIFYFPTMFGYFLESANSVPANPLVTPAHITPPWYMAPFYSILRAVPNKFAGITLAAGAIAMLFVLPWLDRSKVRSIHFRGIGTKIGLTVLVVSFVVLGYLGTVGITPMNLLLARIFTVLYFGFFISLPFYSKYEKHEPVPEKLHCA